MRTGQLHKEKKKIEVQLSVNQTLKDKLEKINLKKQKNLTRVSMLNSRPDCDVRIISYKKN